MKNNDKIKSILIIGCIFLLVSIKCHAQSGGINSILQEQVPLSPNASELGKYGQIPVGLFTGTINYSIPIYSIKLKKIEIPITANYSSNGVHVDKYESSLGIDWSLNAGGVINRILYDDPDESCRIDFPEPPYLINDLRLRSIIGADCADTQLDVFTFNVNGHKGKFILDENFQPKHIEPSPVKIERTISITEPEYKLTTPDGTIFWLGGNNGSESAFSRIDRIMGGGISPPSDRHTTSWYVSKIKTIDNQEINFNYRLTNKIRHTGIMQSVKALSNIVYTSAQHEFPIVTITYSTESFLENISWDEGEINFEGSDLINSIKVRNKNNSITNQFDFNYLTATSNANFQNPDCNFCGSNIVRKFLSEIIKKDPTNSNNEQKHSFEYYEPSALPPRLTYARDHWGYFNGKSNLNLVSNDVSTFNQNDYSSNASEKFNYNYVQNLFENLSGNKNADPNYGIKGLLKKITFPTGGYNELTYEAHSVYREKQENTNETKYLAVNTSTQFSNHASIVVISPIEQKVFLNSSVAFQTGNNPSNDCIRSNYPTHWIRGSITVLDMTTNQFVSFYSKTQGLDTNIGTSFSIIGENSIPGNIYVKLNQNHQYSFKISLTKPCLSMGLNFNYVNQSQLIYSNIPVGGMRIKNIKSNDEKGNVYSEDYKYGNDSCLDCSSGIMETLKPAISFFQSGSNAPGTFATFECRLGSNSLNTLYFSQGYHIAYPTVYQFTNNSYGKGYRKNTFDIVFDNVPIVMKGDWIVGTPYSNGFGNGNILLEENFNANSLKISETLYSYSFDSNFNSSYQSFNVNLNFEVSIFSPTLLNSILHCDFNINKYFLYSKRKYLSNKVSKQYFYDSNNNLNGIETTSTSFIYNNPEHLQLTNQFSFNSVGDTLETKYSYAHEENNTALIAKNMIGIPLKTETLKNGEKLSTQETVYKDWGNNLLAPEIIRTAKGSQSLEDKLKYNVIDNTIGNPLEIQQESGIKIVYIWGYNKTQPIAKIENATYASIPSSTITNLQNLSNTGTEANLIAALNALRVSLPNAMVTTYTYKPLIGISTITDPKGDTQTYHYDSFNRLQFVKDSQGNILSENQYHYKE